MVSRVSQLFHHAQCKAIGTTLQDSRVRECVREEDLVHTSPMRKGVVSAENWARDWNECFANLLMLGLGEKKNRMVA